MINVEPAVCLHGASIALEFRVWIGCVRPALSPRGGSLPGRGFGGNRMSQRPKDDASLEAVAGNGLLHRRLFLTQGAALLGGAGLLSARPSAAETLEVPAWMKAPGTHMSAYGQPSKYESDVQRVVGGTPNVVGNGVSFTPHHRLHGTITPNSLHFERHHSGVPDIDPDAASVADSRRRAAAADVHGRRAAALPDRHADPVSRVRGQ